MLQVPFRACGFPTLFVFWLVFYIQVGFNWLPPED